MYDEIEGQQDAGPNDEERGQPHVPSRASLARSSSSVSFALGHSTTRMAAAYSIKLERPLGEADASFRSEALAREVTDLNWTATEMGLRPLSEYCSPQFFSADEGVRTVQTLFREIAAWPPGVKETADILRDLKECEHILCAAAEGGVRFHFEVDVEHEPVAS